MSRHFLIFVLLTILLVPPVFADSESTQISNSSNDSVAPSIATDGTDIYVTWTDQSRSGPSMILFSKSIDGGNTFGVPQTIGNKQGTSIAPSIATDGTDIYVTWTDSHPKSRAILFSKSTDGGNTFGMPQNISSDSLDSFGSKIIVDGTNIFLTWTSSTWSGDFYKNMEIYFSKSTDGGKTFSVPQNVSNNEEFSQSPSIATYGSDIFITWSDDHMGGTAIFLSKSTDGGKTFSVPQNISNNTEYSVGSSVAADGPNVFVTWFHHVGGKNPDILFSKSTDGGNTFSAPQNISNTNDESVLPVVATDGTDIYITWTESQPNSSRILFSKSTDGGNTFSAPQTISSNAGFSSYQTIATDGTGLLNAWAWKHSFEDRSNIFFLKSTFVLHLTENNSKETLNDTGTVLPQQDQPKEPNVSNDTDTSPVKSLQWLYGHGANYSLGGIGIIRMNNSDLNVNKQLMDIPTIHVWSDTDTKGIPVDMIETGADTGVFYADIVLSGIESTHLQLQVSKGDTITASFDDDSSDVHLVDTAKINSEYPSPRKQIESGIPADQVQCEDGLQLVFKYTNDASVCVTYPTGVKLIERGWGTCVGHEDYHRGVPCGFSSSTDGG